MFIHDLQAHRRMDAGKTMGERMQSHSGGFIDGLHIAERRQSAGVILMFRLREACGAD
jgi:hypothetical protein